MVPHAGRLATCADARSPGKGLSDPADARRRARQLSRSGVCMIPTPFTLTDARSLTPRSGLVSDRLFEIENGGSSVVIRWSGNDRWYDLDGVRKPEDLLSFLAQISMKNWPMQTPARTANLIFAISQPRGWGHFSCVPSHQEGPKARRRHIQREREKITPQIRFSILTRDGFRCRCCGISAADALMQVDHIIPVTKGGLSTPDNLQALCSLCNFGKGNI